MEAPTYRIVSDQTIEAMIGDNNISRSRVLTFEAEGCKPVVFCIDQYQASDLGVLGRRILRKTSYIEAVAGQILQRCLPNLCWEPDKFRMMDFHPHGRILRPQEIRFDSTVRPYDYITERSYPGYLNPTWHTVPRDEAVQIVGEEVWHSLLDIELHHDGSYEIWYWMQELKRNAIPYRVKRVKRGFPDYFINGTSVYMNGHETVLEHWGVKPKS